MKKMLAATMLVAFVLTGCNTVKGVGQDVSKAGDSVTNTAEKVENKLKFKKIIRIEVLGFHAPICSKCAHLVEEGKLFFLFFR